MKVNLEPRPALAVSLNSAWQKTLSFNNLKLGDVNRAFESHETGGGKGTNVARVFRLLGCPVSVAAFVGGFPGESLRRDFEKTGVRPLLVNCRGVTRCVYTVINHARGEATELIEPSAPISEEELSQMRTLLLEEVPRHGIVALCGSLPPCVTSSFYAEIAAMAKRSGVPVVLDAAKDIGCVLEEGVTLLKINAEELSQVTDGEHDAIKAGMALLARFKGLSWLAVTDGGMGAHLMSKNGVWRFKTPRLEKIVSPIGGGDCATAIMARRLAEDPLADDMSMPGYFAEALACASASCLTDTPSVFEPSAAQDILRRTAIERLI
ncbi:MAG: hypothetical protein IKZ46_00965 [Victivallales bacterium]|nr:hypothetical protein [Victivallales bacterium]